jgi:UDPglucose 6-dehydrogenase
MKRIGFIGLGKLGLDCAEVFAQQYPTCGYDIYPRSSDMVKVYNSPSDVIENSDWIFIAVPTPHSEGYDGSVPSSHMEPKDFGHDAVVQALGFINEYATEPKKVVLISTVLPGTTRRKFATFLKKEHQFLYNPYLIAMGSVKWDMANPEMVMIGTETGDPAEMQELVEIYKPLMQNKPRYVTGTWDECEAIKIFYNTFISAKVGLANMIQDFALKIGNINVDVVTDALANSTMRIMGPKYMTAGMGDAGACHPRDNIALRWLAQEYDIGYDMFDTIMHAREIQAKNLAKFLIEQVKELSPAVEIHGVVTQPRRMMPIAIHGKAYKPDVPYCIGSYSTLVGHYIKEAGYQVFYVDPLADDRTDCINELEIPAVILMAHNRKITYGYTGEEADDLDYFKFKQGSIIVDPWRKEPERDGITVIHYGNTRK